MKRETKYVTIEEAARLAGVSVATIFRRMRDGTLPVVRTALPKRTLVDASALRLLLNLPTSGPNNGRTG